MKREILFRGKSPKGHWIYGMPSYDLKYIFNDSNYDSYDQFEIIPETVGQFTGLTDKNGVKIFEGDVVRATPNYTYVIRWENGAFYAYHTTIKVNGQPYIWGLVSRFNELCMEIEVIGSIHDNPELINK